MNKSILKFIKDRMEELEEEIKTYETLIRDGLNVELYKQIQAQKLFAWDELRKVEKHILSFIESRK